ncbi:MAG: ATP-binding cassette domain-containing protein [Methanobacteriota archaeon]|nr:MAG: ATP-binding cassette domain-containing protein [Euryarchaeota archaeon]
MTVLLSVKDLSKRYDGRWVFKDLTFKVSRGERLAVIGPNGSGKTTLVRMLSLLETPTGGEIYLDGESLLEAPEKWAVRRKMAVVFKRPAVLNTTVYGNIALGLKVRGEKKDSIHEKVEWALKEFNLRHLEDRNARALSGGEKQLLSIARALVLEPLLLLLDEPTSNLDPENAALVEDVIKNTGSTVIITSPTESAARIADRTIYMAGKHR